MSAHDECPHCGARFRRGRPACPECGSDARTGWAAQEEIDYQSVEIPDFWDEATHGPRRPGRLWLCAALLALVAAVAMAFLFR
jgi:hypothetical protein